MKTTQQRLKTDMIRARKNGDRETDRTLRTLLAAIDNAEAVDQAMVPQPTYDLSGEVPRKTLTELDIQRTLLEEIAQRTSAIEAYEQHGRNDEAVGLKTEVALIRSYLE
jgi:hypothetical protein